MNSNPQLTYCISGKKIQFILVERYCPTMRSATEFLPMNTSMLRNECYHKDVRQVLVAYHEDRYWIGLVFRTFPELVITFWHMSSDDYRNFWDEPVANNKSPNWVTLGF